MFVVPGVVDGTARFTWYETPPPVLSWREIVELDRSSPLRFEAHTLSHPNLTSLDDADAWHEIAGSREVLGQHLGRVVTTFCYPGGFYGEREVSMVAAAGYLVAVTCDPGVNSSSMHPLSYRRTAIDGWDTLMDFRAKLAGAHDRPLPLQALYRRFR
jgi:peptidoglycan/xylan/chitin deacetylase (PgdA/CDA1 family)